MKIRYVAHKAFNNKGQLVASCLQTPAGIFGFLKGATKVNITRYRYLIPHFGLLGTDETLSAWKQRVRYYGAVRFQKVIIEREVQS